MIPHARAHTVSRPKGLLRADSSSCLLAPRDPRRTPTDTPDTSLDDLPAHVRQVADEVLLRNDKAHRWPFQLMGHRLGLPCRPCPDAPDAPPDIELELSPAPVQGLLAPTVAAAVYGGLAAGLAFKGAAVALNGTKMLMCITAVGSLYDLYATGMGVLKAHKAEVKCLQLRNECIDIIDKALAAMGLEDDPRELHLLIDAAQELLKLLDGMAGSFEKQHMPSRAAACWKAKRGFQVAATEHQRAQARLYTRLHGMVQAGAPQADIDALRRQVNDEAAACAEMREIGEAIPKPRLRGVGPWRYWCANTREGKFTALVLQTLHHRWLADDASATPLPAVVRDARAMAKGVLTEMIQALSKTRRLDPVGGISQYEAKFWRDVPVAAAQPLVLVGAHTALMLQAPGALTGVAAVMLPLTMAQGLLDLKDVKRSQQGLATEKTTRLDALERITDELMTAEADGPESALTRSVMHCALNQQLSDLKTRKHKQVIARLRGGNATASLSVWMPANILTLAAVGVAGIVGTSLASGGIALGVIGALASVTAVPLLGAIGFLKAREWRLEAKARREFKDAQRFLQALEGAQGQAGALTLQAFMNADDEDREAGLQGLALAPGKRPLTADRLARNPYVVSAYLTEGLCRGAHRRPCPGYPSPARLQRWATLLGVPLPLIDSLAPVCDAEMHMPFVRQLVARALGRHWYGDEATATPPGEQDRSGLETPDGSEDTADLFAERSLERAEAWAAADGTDPASQAAAPEPLTVWLGRLDAAMKTAGQARHNRVQRSLGHRGVPLRNPLGTPARTLEALRKDPSLAPALIAGLQLTAADHPEWLTASQRARALAATLDDNGIKAAPGVKRRLEEMAELMDRLTEVLDVGAPDAAAAAAA